MKKNAIVYTVDDNIECLLQMTTSIMSVRCMQPSDYDIFILTNKPRSWMNDIGGAHVVDVNELVSSYGLYDTSIMWRKRPVPPMLMFRLLIPLVRELQGYDKVLYLDTDTEIWNRKFFSIFDMSSEHEIIGVEDSLKNVGVSRRITNLHNRIPGFRDKEGIFNRWNDLMYGSAKYINSGVLVFNMRMFDSGYSERISYIIDRMKEFKPKYSDQDTINIYFDLFVVTDRRYNKWGSASSNIYLYHYVGSVRKHSSVYPVNLENRPKDILDVVSYNDDMGVLRRTAEHAYVIRDLSSGKKDSGIASWLALHGVSDITTVDSAPTGRYDGLLDIIPHDNVKPEHLDSWICHYHVIIDALKKGYRKIAVFEDGFNPKRLDDTVASLKNDFDVAMLADTVHLLSRNSFKAKNSKGYILSTKAMVDLRRLYESLWDPSTAGRRLRYTYKWLNSNILVKERIIA